MVVDGSGGVRWSGQGGFDPRTAREMESVLQLM
jgi:hypothetical protein